VADLEQLHEAQEVIQTFLEAQRHHFKNTVRQTTQLVIEAYATPLFVELIRNTPQKEGIDEGDPHHPHEGLAGWEETLPPKPSNSMAPTSKEKALRNYCNAVLAFIRRPDSAPTQKEVCLPPPTTKKF